jgi:hypothetical protein
MASGITASRRVLGDALAAGGLRVAYSQGKVNPPGVLVLATDPWLTPTHLVTASTSLRWRVIAVAGRADEEVTVEALEDLVAAIVLALGTLPDGWGTPAFDGPATVDLAGATYLTATGRLDHVTEV